MNHIKQPDNRGQSLVIFALVMIAMLVIAALVIDGGMVYSHRRTAQAAADAAVLAGTYELCISDDPSGAEGAAEAKALEYVNRNRADSTPIIDIFADSENMTVDVTTHITFDTFFAHLVGRPTLTAEAHAQSGCACVSAAQGVLPVAWSCRWSVNQQSHPDNCLEQTLSYPDALDRWYQRTPQSADDISNDGLLVYRELYVLMDTREVSCPASRPNCLQDFLCQEDGGLIDCDLDNDGSRDLYSGGNRSWLDLDGGGGGASSLSDWVDNGFDGELHVHEWLAGQTGADTSVFRTTINREGDIVAVPVFDQSCPGVPSADPGNDCASYFHTDPPDDVTDTVVLSGGSSTDYFHIVGFASFLITCVDGPGANLGPTASNPNSFCPGRNYIIDTYRSTIPGINNLKTIEGYFIRGPIPGAEAGDCSGGVDTDSFVLRIQQ
ncbi:MAG: TadE/TadG family type IV pilus assembly protein [Anaerolineales bacterium]